MTDAALELEGVSSGYGTARVVRGVSLRLAPGEVLAVLGKNGMGKTTLLRTVMGYNALQEGRLRILGADMAGTSVHRRARIGVAYAPQERALFQDLSVRDNLRLGLVADRGLPKALDCVRALFPFLAERLGQAAGTLSGGEQKMLILARALMAGPKLVLVDEISEGLQPSVVDRLAGVLRQAARAEDRAMLLVEQHVGFALSVADRYVVLKLGEIVAAGDAADPAARDRIEAHLSV